jgi:hypothetical protein
MDFDAVDFLVGLSGGAVAPVASPTPPTPEALAVETTPAPSGGSDVGPDPPRPEKPSRRTLAVAFQRPRSILGTCWASGPRGANASPWRGAKMGNGTMRDRADGWKTRRSPLTPV